MSSLCSGCRSKQQCSIVRVLNKKRTKKECPCQNCLLKVCCESSCTVKFMYRKSLDLQFLKIKNKRARKRGKRLNASMRRL